MAEPERDSTPPETRGARTGDHDDFGHGSEVSVEYTAASEAYADARVKVPVAADRRGDLRFDVYANSTQFYDGIRGDRWYGGMWLSAVPPVDLSTLEPDGVPRDTPLIATPGMDTAPLGASGWCRSCPNPWIERS